MTEDELFRAVHEYAFQAGIAIDHDVYMPEPDSKICAADRVKLMAAIREWASSAGAMPGWFSAWGMLKAKEAVCDLVMKDDAYEAHSNVETYNAIKALRALQESK